MVQSTLPTLKFGAPGWDGMSRTGDAWRIVEALLLKEWSDYCGVDARTGFQSVHLIQRSMAPDYIAIAEGLGWITPFDDGKTFSLHKFANHINWFDADVRGDVINKYGLKKPLLESKVKQCEREMKMAWCEWVQEEIDQGAALNKARASKLLMQYKLTKLRIKTIEDLNNTLKRSRWDRDIGCFKHPHKGWAFMWDVWGMEEITFRLDTPTNLNQQQIEKCIDFVFFWRLRCLEKVTIFRTGGLIDMLLAEFLKKIDFSNSKNLKTLDALSFEEVPYLESIILPDGLEEIGEKCFFYCVKLSSIRIPDSVKAVGKECFSGCDSLREVTLSNELTILDSEVFRGCIGLEAIDIPDRVTTLGERVFEGCSGLKTIKFSTSSSTLRA